MSMKHNFSGTDPDAYVDSLDGWRRETVQALRGAAHAAGGAEERIKWGHLVGLANGPVWPIRAEEARVLFGFWRGERLRALEPGLKASGKYELANLILTKGDRVDIPAMTALVEAAVALNLNLGDPTRVVRRV